MINASTKTPGLKVSIVPNGGAMGDTAFSPNPIGIKTPNNDVGSYTVRSGSGANDTDGESLLGPDVLFFVLSEPESNQRQTVLDGKCFEGHGWRRLVNGFSYVIDQYEIIEDMAIKVGDKITIEIKKSDSSGI